MALCSSRGLTLFRSGVVGIALVLGMSFVAACRLIGSGGPTTTTTTTTTVLPPVGPGELRYPVEVSGRKVLDQEGAVFLMRTFSSWGMAQQLSDAEITTALEGVAANGFNAVTVFVGGGYEFGSPPSSGWNRYTNAAGEGFWTGTPWASGLGPGWSSIDWIVQETQRLGLAVNLSFGSAFGDTGAGDDWERVTDAEMYDVGVAVAGRYVGYPHIVWHIMFDDASSPVSLRGQRIDALFHGINDREGASRRPVRWVEPANGASTWGQILSGTQFSHVNVTLNGWYDYGSDSAVIAETGYAEVNMAVGDVEPPYDGAPHYSGNPSQQLRERSYATFLEGGVYINYGHEDWWPFGAQGLYSEGLDWTDVITHSDTVRQRHVWSLIDAYVADTTWAPTNFVTTGTGAGDTKAAAGASQTAAIAYFPSPRDVVVDTTVIAGTAPVRVRWYDPTNGSYTTIATSEPQTPARAVTYPSAHNDGTHDWVLVIDTP